VLRYPHQTNLSNGHDLIKNLIFFFMQGVILIKKNEKEVQATLKNKNGASFTLNFSIFFSEHFYELS